MTLLALGINHKTAPVAVREKVSFAPESMQVSLQGANGLGGIHEVVILSTCNRTEIYCAAEHNPQEELLRWLSQNHSVSMDELRRCQYSHTDEDAVKHMMRVASGLDSLVLGEPQIFGQMKSSFAVAQEAGTIGPELGRLFRQTFSVAKQVRTDTAIGQNPVSVAFAAVSLAQRIFANLSKNRALLVGAGETIDLVARHLVEAGVKEIVVANRTLARAQALAEQFGARAVLLSDIPDELPLADIIISSTASPLPILGKGAVERALKKRKHAPMFMVDIAVPRDIEQEVGDLSDVYLYTVDDLKDIIEDNVRARQDAARDAEEIILAGAADFMRQLRSLDAVTTLRAFRHHAEILRDAELEKALKRLNAGDDAEQILRQLASQLTNKFLHTPSVVMRKASADGRHEVMSWAQELFALTDLDVETPDA